MDKFVISTRGPRTDIRAVSPDPSVPYAGRLLAFAVEDGAGLLTITWPPTKRRPSDVVATVTEAVALVERAA